MWMRLLSRWYLYRYLLLAQLLYLAFGGICGWYIGQQNDFETSLGDSSVSNMSGSLEGKIYGFESSLELTSVAVGLVSCEDLNGVGSFNTTCLLNSNVHINSSIYAFGVGNLEILPHLSIVCPIAGCSISFNVSGGMKVGPNSAIIASTVIISAYSLSIGQNFSVNITSRGGRPPPQTSGSPAGYDGEGGGYGGRGASCLRNEQVDAWGGDVYSWSNMSGPWSYGIRGSGRSAQIPSAGNGGGCVKIITEDEFYLNGSVTAEGGNGGVSGGGGSGRSIIISAYKLKGLGTVSAAGGRGWGGGGGGRISLHCYSVQDVEVKVHGGFSIGCPENAGGAGTYYDDVLYSLTVSNDNFSTET